MFVEWMWHTFFPNVFQLYSSFWFIIYLWQYLIDYDSCVTTHFQNVCLGFKSRYGDFFFQYVLKNILYSWVCTCCEEETSTLKRMTISNTILVCTKSSLGHPLINHNYVVSFALKLIIIHVHDFDNHTYSNHVELESDFSRLVATLCAITSTLSYTLNQGCHYEAVVKVHGVLWTSH